MMQCPKCQHERQPAATACPACGVIYDKYDPERAAQLERMRERLAKTRPIYAPAVPEQETSSTTPIDQPLPRGSDAEMPGNTAVCTRCEEIGHVVVRKPGSDAVQVALILLMLVPGIVYYVWRNKETKQVCGACGSDQVVAARTRVGRKIVETQFPNVFIGKNQVATKFVKPTFGRLTGLFLVLLAVGMTIQGFSLFWGGSDLALPAVLNLVLAAAMAYGAWRCFTDKGNTVSVNDQALTDWRD